MIKQSNIFLVVLIALLLSGCGGSENRQDTELTEVVQEEIIENATDENIVTEVSVTDVYSDVINGNVYSDVVNGDGIFCYHIPQVIIDNDSSADINTKMNNELSAILKDYVYNNTENGYLPEIEEMTYQWGRKDDIVSVIVAAQNTIDWTDYYVYSFSTETGKEVSMNELIGIYGLSEQEFYELSQNTIKRYWEYRSDLISDIGENEYTNLMNQTLEDENIKAIIPYINEDGELCIVTKVYWMAGAGEYLRMFNTNVSSEVEESYLDCVLDHSDRIVIEEEVISETELSETVTETKGLDEKTISIKKEELLGEWELDSEYTMEYNDMSLREMYGSSISGTNPLMVFQEDGSFSYYIAYDYGNGSYILEEDGVLINLTELDSGERVRKLLLTEAGKVRIGMEHDFFWTFWIKKQ